MTESLKFTSLPACGMHTTKEIFIEAKNYIAAYRRLNTITPLRIDCGGLCNSACCHGDENRGMLLYPGEEELFNQKDEDWYSLKNSTTVLKDGRIIQFLVCNGSCPRERRPLACRIFPLAPFITEDGMLEFRPDIRAAGVCPLVNSPEPDPIQSEFIDAVYDAFGEFINFEEIIEFLDILTREYITVMRLIDDGHAVTAT